MVCLHYICVICMSVHLYKGDKKLFYTWLMFFIQFDAPNMTDNAEYLNSVIDFGHTKKMPHVL